MNSPPRPLLSIRETRKALGLTQVQFGLLVDRHPITISDLENGRAMSRAFHADLFAVLSLAAHLAGDRIDFDVSHVLENCGPVYTLYRLLHVALGPL